MGGTSESGVRIQGLEQGPLWRNQGRQAFWQAEVVSGSSGKRASRRQRAGFYPKHRAWSTTMAGSLGSLSINCSLGMGLSREGMAFHCPCAGSYACMALTMMSLLSQIVKLRIREVKPPARVHKGPKAWTVISGYSCSSSLFCLQHHRS